MKNEKGLSSIVLGVYLLIILSVMASVMYGSAYLTGLFAKRQLDSFQNNYDLERGIYYALDVIRDDPSILPGTYTYTPWPPEGALIVMNVTLSATTPVYNKYEIKSSTSANAPASMPRRTVTVEYENGKMLSYTVSSS